MADDAYTVCPECGQPVRRVVTMPRVAVKAAAESPRDSVKRLLGTSRPHFDCPYPNKETGECERVWLDSGSKKEREAKVQDAVLRTKWAERRNLKRSDIKPTNL